MDYEEIKLPMDIQAIQECIPHRHPFLLVERIVEFVPYERMVATNNISIANPVFVGHFPGNPVYPGVLIVEGAAQAATVFGNLSCRRRCEQCYLTEISSTRFRRQVVPGDVLRYELILKKRRDPFFWFEAKAMVEEDVAAQTSFSAYMK